MIWVLVPGFGFKFTEFKFISSKYLESKSYEFKYFQPASRQDSVSRFGCCTRSRTSTEFTRAIRAEKPALEIVVHVLYEFRDYGNRKYGLSEPFTVTAYQNIRTDIYETLSDKISGS